MNADGILTTQAEQMAFDASKYKYIESPGAYVGKLVARAWGKGYFLRCYFDNPDFGNFIAIAYWKKRKEGNHYGARDTEIDFAKVASETTWKLTYKISSQGNLFWAFAEQVENGGN